MNLTITYQNRDITFKSGNQTGSGINEILSFISVNKKKIQTVQISGKSKSYTFLRQVHLLANMLCSFDDFEVVLNGKTLSPREIALPIYGE